MVPRSLSSSSAEVYITDQFAKNSTEVWLYDDEESVMLP